MKLFTLVKAVSLFELCTHISYFNGKLKAENRKCLLRKLLIKNNKLLNYYFYLDFLPLSSPETLRNPHVWTLNLVYLEIRFKENI